MIFDMDGRRIGFAPALTIYNEGVLKKLENIIINFE